jgi:hypothetical protein
MPLRICWGFLLRLFSLDNVRLFGENIANGGQGFNQFRNLGGDSIVASYLPSCALAPVSIGVEHFGYIGLSLNVLISGSNSLNRMPSYFA